MPKISKISRSDFRRRCGYCLTLLSLAMLLGGFLTAVAISRTPPAQRLLGAAITLLPLLLFTPRAVRHDSRAYQALALLAPVYFFFGGVIWLWQKALWGAWFCLAAGLLELGVILHNFRRPRRG